MSDAQEAIARMLNANTVTFTIGQLRDPNRESRPNFSKLLGIARAVPEESPKEETDSQASDAGARELTKPEGSE